MLLWSQFSWDEKKKKKLKKERSFFVLLAFTYACNMFKTFQNKK